MSWCNVQKIFICLVATLFIGSVIAPVVSAQSLNQDDSNSINSDTVWYAPGSAGTCGSATTATGGSTSGGSYNLDQVKAFASSPITSTWNISDSTVEQWFLKQSGALATITKYGLTSGNIGRITSVVKAANVSPVFFYLYAVNEGGGAGGFINHYGSDIPGGGPANAKRDAEYLASESQQKGGTPATGGGEPADMPTKEAQNILNSLPAGSVGVVYIQATSAVTAELEELSGKRGDWANLFGKPLSEAMKNIKSMGGDPLQGGATISSNGCASGGVAGQGIAKAMSWAVMIAKNNGYGYDELDRTSGWAKWQSDSSCTHQCGSFDCSSFMAAALTEAGYFKTNPEFTTYYEAQYLAQAGFKNITSSVSLATGTNMQPGDILLNTVHHTAMYTGNNQVVQASSNANGPLVGDQTGQEIWVTQYYNYPWNSVWRASN